ncbi:MAG: ABC transporter permease [Chloroflexi bacterium]|nr:ABC transporter permease [Chloroflexota bacterium]
MNLSFYLQYAARNLWRNRRWSTFAVFSVAAGVATVVALRSLGLAISDALTSNLRSSNYGDITLQRGSQFAFFDEATDNEDVFSEREVKRVAEWAAENNAQMTTYTVTSNIQISSLDFVRAGRPQFISSLFVDPQTFPPTQDIYASDPAGVPLRDLFQGGNEVVISQNLADAQQIKVGDRVRVSGTSDEFIVRGIVPTSVRTGFQDLFAAFFGFAIFDRALQASFPVPEQPNNISLTLPDGATNQEYEDAARQLRARVSSQYGLQIRTVPQLLQQNQQIADVLGSFIVVMGLGALLIGGVGIINTMLVMVGRRTEEIAAMKTFGLQGNQIGLIFLAEAFLLGVAGSIVGGIVGVALSSVANAYGQTLIQQPLTWRIYPEAVLFGAVLGLIITLVFGVLPVLTAVKVRPAIILRPNETHVPRAGVLQSLLALVLVVVSIGLIAGQMLLPAFNVADAASRRGEPPNAYIVGIIGVAITLLILAILVGVMWLIVWLIGKLPAFGIIDLRLALRNLTTRRTRTATTLLALSAGMFALSSISFVGAGVREILQFTLSEAFGGNVLIFPILPPAVANPLIDSKLDAIEGVEYRTRYMQYNGQLQAVNGVAVRDIPNLQSPEALMDAMNRAWNERNVDEMRELSRMLRNFSLLLVSRVSDNPNLSSGDVIAGRDLTPEDDGQRVAVVRMNPVLEAAGVQPGSTITLRIDNRNYEFEVVGLLPYVDPTNMTLQQEMTFGDVTIPPRALDRVNPDFQINIAQVAPDKLNQALVELSALPLIYSLDISFFDGLLSRLINQFSAIPILVGLLSLMAAGVIMANTVALSMLERRRQIGILKAVGLSGERVLSVMLLENTMVSLLGGLLGMGLSAVGVAIMSRFGLNLTVLIPRDALPVAIALVVAAIVIAWLSTFLSAQTVLGERVTNVLRYE